MLLLGLVLGVSFETGILGMLVFLLWPFTRLVHIWSAPVGYLFRAYQIVRAKRTA